METYISRYLREVGQIAEQIDQRQVQGIIDVLVETRKHNGRLFILGVGGGAGNATHAVNDFRKIAEIESYAPTDNVSELTARVNDDGWVARESLTRRRCAAGLFRWRRQPREECQRQHCQGC